MKPAIRSGFLNNSTFLEDAEERIFCDVGRENGEGHSPFSRDILKCEIGKTGDLKPIPGGLSFIIVGLIFFQAIPYP